MIKLKDLLNETKILVYKINDKNVQKFLKKYPKVEKSMKPFLKGDILNGYKKWIRWKDKNEDKLGGESNKVDSKTFGSKVFWKHDWNGVSGWAEVFQYLHKLGEGKLKEYRIRGNADELVISKGDIKKGMMVWFTKDGKGAQKLKVKYTMLSKDGKEEHYITNKGTFTPRDVVGY